MSRSSGTTRRRRRHGQPAACEAKRYAICGIENHGFRGVTNGGKKAAYADYRKAREEMKELLTAKANIDRILELDKEQEEANERREKEAEQR